MRRLAAVAAGLTGALLLWGTSGAATPPNQADARNALTVVSAFVEARNPTLSARNSVSNLSAFINARPDPTTTTPSATTTTVPSAPFLESFTQPDGPLGNGWSPGSTLGLGAGDLSVLGGRGVTGSGSGPFAAYKAHGRNLSGAWTLEFDAFASTEVDQGGISVLLLNLATQRGVGLFVGNAYHVQAWTGGWQHTNNTNSGRSRNPVHVKMTHAANGEFAVYEDGVFQTGTNLTSQVAGPTVLVNAYDTSSPTQRAWIDNLSLREG